VAKEDVDPTRPRYAEGDAMPKKKEPKKDTKPRRMLSPLPRVSLLLGGAPTSFDPERRNRRTEDVMVRLEVEHVRLERTRIAAEEREKDRELIRFRFDERRRLREEREDRERLREEDETALKTLEAGLERVKERIAKRAAVDAELKERQDALPRVTEEPEEEGETLSRTHGEKIASEVAQLFAGTWKPPK